MRVILHGTSCELKSEVAADKVGNASMLLAMDFGGWSATPTFVYHETRPSIAISLRPAAVRAGPSESSLLRTPKPKLSSAPTGATGSDIL